jgi:hypothetical protein
MVFAWNFIPVSGHGEGRFLPVYNTMLVEQQFTAAQEIGTMACIPKKKTKEQVLSTTVLMLDVITSFNFPCYTALFVVYHR